MRVSATPPSTPAGDRNPRDYFRQSDCETLPLELVQSSTASWTGIGAGGLMIAAAAVCLAGRSFTKFRFATGGTAPAAITNCRVAVWDYTTGNRLMDSGDYATATPTGGTALMTGLASYWHEWPLLNTLTLADKTKVWLGMAAIGSSGSVQFRGLSAPNVIATGGGTGAAGSPLITPVLTKTNSSYAGSSPVSQVSGGQTSARPWFALA